MPVHKLKYLMVVTIAFFSIINANMLMAQSYERFDDRIRELFFSGVAGNKTALVEAMDVAEKTLLTNPKHAEALVWHGSGLLLRGRDAREAGDYPKAQALLIKGFAEMDQAVALEPKNIAVLIPRYATLINAAPGFPEPFRRTSLEKVKADLTASVQSDTRPVSQLSEHSLGERLAAFAVIEDLLGNPSASKEYLEMIKQRLPNSRYAAQAEKRLQGDKDAHMTCLGCHKTAVQ